MKKIIIIAAALAAIPASPSLAQTAAITATHVCLQATDIKSTSVVDNRTIIFTMNNGTSWKNTLQADCPGLRSAGAFSYVITGSDVCSNEQRIQVLHGPSSCFLGNFTPVPSKS
jgi:hypothetical protein